MIHLWGESRVIDAADDCIVVIANAAGGNGASSLHTHARHNNAIIVVFGQCVIENLDSAGVSHFETLHRGESLTIPAGTAHRLHFPWPSKIIEWYMLAHGERGRATLEDIQRIEDGWAPREKTKAA